jgi:GNAT superfamily N-acetyltransferase
LKGALRTLLFDRLLVDDNEPKDPLELRNNLVELEFQLFRMQENIKEISKKNQVIGIDQTKEDKWVIVSAEDDGHRCKIMVNDCETAYNGNWDFSIQAVYADSDKIHIGDIKGPANKGYGSICMNYLKDIAREQNIPYITGDIAKRDWDHVDRLIHFYEKHDFDVDIDHKDKSGDIIWSD